VQEDIITERIVYTAGDLRQALQFIQKHKNIAKAKEAAKSVGKATVVGIIGALAGAASAPALIAAAAKMGAIEAGTAAYDAYKAAQELDPAEKKKNPFFDYLSIDPDTTDIVDDKLENEFEKEFLSRLRYYDDEDELPDADRAFTSWLKNKFNQSHVTK
jgi:hypothetical protein